jgi:hypothetical protein
MVLQLLEMALRRALGRADEGGQVGLSQRRVIEADQM